VTFKSLLLNAQKAAQKQNPQNQKVPKQQLQNQLIDKLFES